MSWTAMLGHVHLVILHRQQQVVARGMGSDAEFCSDRQAVRRSDFRKWSHRIDGRTINEVSAPYA